MIVTAFKRTTGFGPVDELNADMSFKLLKGGVNKLCLSSFGRASPEAMTAARGDPDGVATGDPASRGGEDVIKERLITFVGIETNKCFWQIQTIGYQKSQKREKKGGDLMSNCCGSDDDEKTKKKELSNPDKPQKSFVGKYLYNLGKKDLEKEKQNRSGKHKGDCC